MFPQKLPAQQLNGQLFSLPVQKFVLNSPFGARLHPVTFEKGEFHFGIDLRARSDTVFSILAGKVSMVLYNEIIGMYMVVQHGNYTSIYGHLSKVFVPAGTEIYPGEVIAMSGSTGRVTGPHLHFGVKKAGRFIEPLRFLFLISRLDAGQLEDFLKN